ncbi:MAG: universal stress protein [Alphaproteobacteria bacterium PA4]|nr:MAG: universal stress protein [Alphaproteobacteria bacterium PA4]
METAPTYLVVIDDSPESRVALRFAAMRASHVNAKLALIHVLPRPEFMQWGGVQEAMAAEARTAAEALLASMAEEAVGMGSAAPVTTIVEGEATTAIFNHVRQNAGIRALVLAAAAKGTPGPLVSYFAGERAGQLPCVLIIVPGGLAPDRLESLT